MKAGNLKGIFSSITNHLKKDIRKESSKIREQANIPKDGVSITKLEGENSNKIIPHELSKSLKSQEGGVSLAILGFGLVGMSPLIGNIVSSSVSNPMIGLAATFGSMFLGFAMMGSLASDK